LIFSTTCPKKILILRRSQRDIINVPHFQVTHPLFLSDFNEMSVFSRFSKNTLITKFHENTFSESRVFPRGQTTDSHTEDRHSEANSRLSQFCKSA